MKRFSYNHCLRLLRKAGARQVNFTAAEELRDTIEAIAIDLSKRAVQFAYDRKRRKINRDDVKAAMKEFLQEEGRMDETSFKLDAGEIDCPGSARGDLQSKQEPII